MKFVATKKDLATNFFSSLSFVDVFGSGNRDPGSRMGKNQDPDLSRIRNTGVRCGISSEFENTTVGYFALTVEGTVRYRYLLVKSYPYDTVRCSSVNIIAR